MALVLANSPLAESYFAFWELELGFSLGSAEFSESLLHWINDGLMAFFFFVVGLEIKREFLVGELSSVRQAILPIMAAVGGMVVPAAIYLLVLGGREGANGWGIPMATDIAFALGVLALLGSRIPNTLKIFLTALAIADDIGAVLVIAFFYTSEIAWIWLGIAAIFFVVLTFCALIRVQAGFIYILLALGVWVAFLESGIHATIAGVLIALVIPAKSRAHPVEFVAWGHERLNEIERINVPDAHVLETDDQQAIARALQVAARSTQAPLQRLMHDLHPLTTFIVLPLFALANAGISFEGVQIGDIALQPVSFGVFLGLVLGKQIGITLFSFLTVRLGLADLPPRVEWPELYGAAWLGGIGFTMSLFVSSLAFDDPLLLAEAKLAILVASVVSGVVGYLILRSRANIEIVEEIERELEQEEAEQLKRITGG